MFKDLRVIFIFCVQIDKLFLAQVKYSQIKLIIAAF